MDKIIKDLPINEARKLIHNLIDVSDIDTIENFWLIELDNLHLSVKDSITCNRILNLKNDKSEDSQILYKNCLSGNPSIISELLKKNWRRLFNNSVIEKYYKYRTNKIIFMSETTNNILDTQIPTD